MEDDKHMPSPEKEASETGFINTVGNKAERKLRAQRKKYKTIWFGFSMAGLVGWSVTIPGVLGTLLGIWIDKHYKNSYSWTLMLMLIGVMIGCLLAWNWMNKEREAARKDREENVNDIS